LGYAKRESEALYQDKHGEMKHLSTEAKQQLDWRRSKVLELSSQGYSEREIAEKLQPIAPITVHRDLYLRQQAQSSGLHHGDANNGIDIMVLPTEYRLGPILSAQALLLQ
jgi:FKBP-type peptidyl-prolyl cis-trans isomerase (trigger factor)